MGRSRGRTRITKRSKGTKKLKKGALPKAKPQTPTIESALPAVCSECYGDYLISTKTTSDRITCPGCGHIGLIEADTFEVVSSQRQNHQKNFIIATATTCLSFFFILLYGLFNSWPFGVEKSADGTYVPAPADETTNMILLGLGLVLLAAGLFLMVRYEKSRVEIYF